MKHKLKNYIKLGILLFGITLVITNCQKEDTFEEKTSTNPSFTYKVTSLNELTKLKPVISNVKKMTPKTTSFNRDLPDFLPLENIDESKVIQYTDSTGYSTYTFKIINEDNNSINFENLYLLETEQGYIGYILSYEPNEDWYFSDANISPEGNQIFNIEDYQGDITKYSFERELIWTTKAEYATNSTANRASLEVCTITTVELCDFGGTWHVRGPNCMGNLAYTQVESCTNVWFGSGGSGTSSGSNEGENGNNGDGSSTGGGGSSTSTDCNTSGTSIVNNQPLAGVNNGCAPNEGTGVFPPVEDDDTPCEKLNQLTQTDSLSVNIKPIIDSLKAKTSLNKEYSISFRKTMVYGQVRSSADPIGFRQGQSNTSSPIRIGPYWFGQAHTHPIGTFGMFSWSDLYRINNLYLDLNSAFKKDAFLMIVNHDGTVYALKINDFMALNAAIANDLDNALGSTIDEKVENLNEEIQKEYKKDPNDLERVFLREFGNFGITIYKASDENISNWNKLEMNGDIINPQVNEIPCN